MVGTMSNPARPGERQKPACSELLKLCGNCSARVPRAMVEAAAGLMGKQGCLPPQSSQPFFWVEKAPRGGIGVGFPFRPAGRVR